LISRWPARTPGSLSPEQPFATDLKSRNRRVERSRLEGVKQRSRKRWDLPSRVLSTTASMIFVILLGAFVLWKGGNWLRDELFYENGFFAIERIRIISDGVIDRQYFRAWSRIHDGENLLELDLARVKRDLESIPWVREAAVKRVLPDTIMIQITERNPVALVTLVSPVGNQGKYRRIVCQVDAEGFPARLPLKYLNRETQEADYNRLPRLLLSGNVIVRETRRIESEQIQLTLRFLTEFNKSSLRRKVAVASIDVSGKYNVRINMRDGSEVLLGTSDFSRQISRWQEIIEESEIQQKAIGFLDLSVPNYLPVRWADIENGQPSGDQTTLPTSANSRNV
jgi:cell division septal protein FtsQ